MIPFHRWGDRGTQGGSQHPMGTDPASMESQFSHIFCPLPPPSASSSFLSPVGRKGVWGSPFKVPLCL